VPGDLILPLALEGENLGSRATFNPGKQAQRAKERTSIRSTGESPRLFMVPEEAVRNEEKERLRES
jgi:hypothetical protein